MNMKIFVISLTSSLNRRENITTQMAEQSLPFEFFDAINGKNEDHPFFKQYCDPKRIRRKGYSLNPGEMGCFASHYSLWEKCIALNEPIVILEDDVHLRKKLSLVLSHVKTYICQLGMVRLSRTLEPTFINVSSFEDTSMIVKYTKPAKGGMGYVLSPGSAKKLILKLKTWYEPVDDYLEKEWLHKMSIFGIEPPCLTHDNSVPSEIGDRKKQKMFLFIRIRREIYRSGEWFLNQIHQFPLNLKIRLGIFKFEKNS